MVGELWDLRAVVEEFSRSRTMPETYSAPNPPEEAQKNEDLLSSAKAEAASQELEEFVKPFFSQPSSEQNKHEEKKSSSPAPKSTKKRKNPKMKVVCELPADALLDNVWAWRKYGQKPIKDSPYPRGYYRCSSSKGCPARKQVERSRTKPGYFVVVYTGEHNHAAPIHRQRSPPLLGPPKIPTFTQISARIAGDGGSPATSPATSSASAVEQQIPPVMKEVARETGRTLLGDELDKLSDDDFIFMDLDLLIDSEADGGGAVFADDLISDDGDVWPPMNAGS